MKLKGMKLSIIQCRDIAEIKAKVDDVFKQISSLLPASKDARIIIKPNHNSYMNALTGNTTDLRLLVAIIKSLQKRGYKNITIGDGTSCGMYRHNYDQFSRLKTAELAKKLHVRIIDFNNCEFEVVDFGNGLQARVASECLNSDFFIDAPKIKMHAEARMSAALKSLVGCLVGLDKRKIHNIHFFENILKLNEKIKPDFYFLDGLFVMEETGPSDGNPIKMDLILAGTDPILIDLAVAKLIGYAYDEVPYLKLAKKMGKIDYEHFRYLESLSILNETKKDLERPHPSAVFTLMNNPYTFTLATKIRFSRGSDYIFSSKIISKILYSLRFVQDMYYDDEEMEIHKISINKEKCNGCKECAKYCPMSIDLPDHFESEECIKCLYCYCVCPKEAISLEGKLGFFENQIKRYDRIIREMIVTNMKSSHS
jgi:uncharacterized protein (DUF362 family)/ferredoxin